MLVKCWLAYNAACSVGGWALSAMGQLNGAGYVALAIAGVALGAVAASARPHRVKPRFATRRHRLGRQLRRFRRPLPAIYLLILIGSIVGGMIYAPSNYDMLTYRLPRMLHWLAAGRWHWIHAGIQRMNYSGVGWEWASMPPLLLTHSTRLLFLLNIVAYLLLPGLLFAFLRSLGAGGRAAWNWMWILPTGLIFVMQTGGGANDTMAVDFVLAAIVFGRRAARSARGAEMGWSLLAAAELSAAKASNLPLILPCAVAVLPAIWVHRGQLLRRPVRLVLVAMLALFSSIAPLLALNWHFTGDYAGSPHDEGKLKLHNPLAGLIGNGIMIAGWALEPPILPLAERIDEVMPALLPRSTANMLERDFPRFSLHLGELPQEEGSGLGLAISVMAALAAGATIRNRFMGKRPRMSPSPGIQGEGRGEGDFKRRSGQAEPNQIHPGPLPDYPEREPKHPRFDRFIPTLICIASYLALLAYMALIGSESAARLITPYYPLVLASLLLGRGNELLARRRWWRRLAILAAASALPGLVLTPSRPLFPAVKWSEAIRQRYPHSPVAARAAEVYAIYAARPDALAPLRSDLPANEKVIGFLGGGDDSEISLWLPLTSGRRVVDILPTDTRADLHAATIHYAIVSAAALSERGQTLPQVLAQYQAALLTTRRLTLKVADGPQDWYVVQLP
jgi:hypothetical protein